MSVLRRDRFSKRDYREAAYTRSSDAKFLRTQDYIYALCTMGVAVECLLRSTFDENEPFEERHELYEIYKKSRFSKSLSQENDKIAFSSKINKIRKIWDNNLRYTAEHRLKRLIGHEMAGCSRKYTKTLSDYLEKEYGDLFTIVDDFIKKGEEVCPL